MNLNTRSGLHMALLLGMIGTMVINQWIWQAPSDPKEAGGSFCCGMLRSGKHGKVKWYMFYLLVLLVGSLVLHLQFSFVCVLCAFCVWQCMSKGFWLEAMSRVCFRVRGWLYFTYPPHSSTKFMDFALLFPLCNSIATGFLHFYLSSHFFVSQTCEAQRPALRNARLQLNWQIPRSAAVKTLVVW